MSAARHQTLTLHGHSIAYVQQGSGPVLLLIHGMAGALDTWRSVIEPRQTAPPCSRSTSPGMGRPARAAGTTRSDRWRLFCAMC